MMNKSFNGVKYKIEGDFITACCYCPIERFKDDPRPNKKANIYLNEVINPELERKHGTKKISHGMCHACEKIY